MATQKKTTMNPCPFCNARDNIVIHCSSQPTTHVVHCSACHAEGPPAPTIKGAEEAWNKSNSKGSEFLEWASKSDILNELMRRDDKVGLVLGKITNIDGEDRFRLSWRGSLTLAYGIAARCRVRLAKGFKPGYDVVSDD